MDIFIDSTLNKFFIFINSPPHIYLKKFTKDPNFVVYQDEIIKLINDFIKTVSATEIIKIIKKKEYLPFIYNILKKYCGFCIYLGIGYYYKEGKDLYITNIIESSKKNFDNFFNSINNSKIIMFFNEIKNILLLYEFKTIDKIKIIISNNPLKYESTVNFFKELGEDYIINNFFINNNFENIIKTLIFTQLYIKNDKNEINQIINEVDKEEGEYKYIEIIVSNEKKIVDFTVIQKFLSVKELRSGLAEEIYNYIEEYQNTKEILIMENQDFINYLFTNKIIIPISEEFLRYHKDSEKHENISDNKNDSKIKNIVNKINNVKNYYSENNKNQETDKLFYRHIDPRMGILYNDNEEIKIIQKISSSENAVDSELLIELENFRKYIYINFKNSLHNFIKLRTTDSIDSIRFINLKKKNKELLETRICNDSIDLNVIGVVFNPNRLNNIQLGIDFFKVKNLVNVTDITKNKNGFISFMHILKSANNSKNNLYYWLFNNNTDLPKLNKYIDYSKKDGNKNFIIMCSEIYYLWIDIIKKKILNEIDNMKIITIMDIEYLIKIYEKKFFNFNLIPETKNNILFQVLTEKIKEIKIIKNTDIIKDKNKIIKLPELNIQKNNKSLIIIEKKITENKLLTNINPNAICNHYIKWDNLEKKSNEDLNQLIFEFVKKYVKQDDKGEYICKSCNELLLLKKYVKEGTYVKELDEFMTTSIVVNDKLQNIPKYNNLNRTIKNLEKILEKIAYICDLFYYIGNDSTTKLHRKTVIKDTIDLILLHTSYLKKQPKNRKEKAVEIYNINKDYTNLFFFELEDNIFLTSSTDTDTYKLLKYNNIIAYLILIIITELNSGQILNLKNDKRCNYFFYSKIYTTLFKDLQLRINDKEKILLTKIPLLTYCIYYFSCILTNNKIWLWSSTDDSQVIIIQKIIVHTVIDLLNTIIEANLEKNKNYLYEILVARFMDKVNHIFNDEKLIKRIDDNINKKISYDSNTKKILYKTKKIDFISINNNLQNFVNENSTKTKKYCNVKATTTNQIKFKFDNNNINSLTNCDNGKFHNFIFENNSLFCNLCNKKYFELLNDVNTTESADNNNDYFEKLKLSFIKKLTEKYCLTGNLHQLNLETGICNLCNINPSTHKYSNNELLKFELIMHKKEDDEFEQNYKNYKDKKNIYNNKTVLTKKIINKFQKNFEKDVINKYKENKLENYIDNFIDKLINLLGNKIKINNKTTYLKDTIYIIDHNYLGNNSKNKITVLSSEKLIKIYYNHPFFNKDVIYYKNVNYYVYYDIITLQYCGYSNDNKNIIKNESSASLKIEYSIKDLLLLLGLENTYTNIYHIDSSLIHSFNDYKININTNNDLINSILRNRINNLKQIISRTQSIIYSVNNNNKITNFYNIKEKSIINEFISKLQNINLFDETKKKRIFKNSKYIINLINLKQISLDTDIALNQNYFNNDILNKAINSDTKLIYYIITNFNKLLDYNKQHAIQTELAYLIIRIIEYATELYFKENNIYNIRKFDYLVLYDEPYIDEKIRIDDNMDLIINDESNDDIKKEENYDAQEAFDSLDIDDYDKDDDIDESTQALEFENSD
jgi:hypothetical protein